MNRRWGRRAFLKSLGIAAGSAPWLAAAGPSWGRSRSPNERLNIGIIGTAGRARSNIEGVESQNLVAFCDIDDRLLDAAQTRFPHAKTYNDFRKLLDRRDLDAVVISTADHTHAPAAVNAMKLGLHVYVEKPLSHSVYEARVVAETAARAKVATQMGTQIHAGNNYRRVVEVIQSGAIGPVRECHVWVGKAWGGGTRPTDTPPVPKYLHWDLWLGPAPERPYHPTYQPANWRRWWDFGSGTLGDMACHYMDLPFWALKLRHPSTVEAEGPPVHPETTPEHLIVRYGFPARGEMPPVKLTWYDGGSHKRDEEMIAINWRGDGVLFVGDKGKLLANYNRYVLLPTEEFEGFEPPEPTIPNSIGHYEEWIKACKTGSPTTCNFDYSGALTETVHLGNVAYRLGKKIAWIADSLKVEGGPEADRFIRREYRKGWTL